MKPKYNIGDTLFRIYEAIIQEFVVTGIFVTTKAVFYSAKILNHEDNFPWNTPSWENEKYLFPSKQELVDALLK